MKFANLDVFTWLSWFRSLNSLHDKIHDTTPFQFNLSLFMITNHSSYKIHTKFHITFFGSILSSRCVFVGSNFEPQKKNNGEKSLHSQPLEAVKEPVKPQEVIRKVSPEAKAAKTKTVSPETTKHENKETRSDLVSQQRTKEDFFVTSYGRSRFVMICVCFCWLMMVCCTICIHLLYDMILIIT